MLILLATDTFDLNNVIRFFPYLNLIIGHCNNSDCCSHSTASDLEASVDSKDNSRDRGPKTAVV